jgi:4-oxalocrotonate tautomerase
MPLVKVTWYAGRTHEQKAELAREITEAVARIGRTTAEQTQVIFEDVATEDWATAGILASDKAK